MRTVLGIVLASVLAASAAGADEVYRSADGRERITARERSSGLDALYNARGRLVGYRRTDAEDGRRSTITNRGGSRRIHFRPRGDRTDALVNERGRVIGYRKQVGENRWRYTRPDGKTLGYGKRD